MTDGSIDGGPVVPVALAFDGPEAHDGEAGRRTPVGRRSKARCDVLKARAMVEAKQRAAAKLTARNRAFEIEGGGYMTPAMVSSYLDISRHYVKLLDVPSYGIPNRNGDLMIRYKRSDIALLPSGTGAVPAAPAAPAVPASSGMYSGVTRADGWHPKSARAIERKALMEERAARTMAGRAANEYLTRLVTRIDTYMEENFILRSELALTMGKSCSYISDILNLKRGANPRTVIEDCMRALGLELYFELEPGSTGIDVRDILSENAYLMAELERVKPPLLPREPKPPGMKMTAYGIAFEKRMRTIDTIRRRKVRQAEAKERSMDEAMSMELAVPALVTAVMPTPMELVASAPEVVAIDRTSVDQQPEKSLPAPVEEVVIEEVIEEVVIEEVAVEEVEAVASIEDYVAGWCEDGGLSTDAEDELLAVARKYVSTSDIRKDDK